VWEWLGIAGALAALGYLMAPGMSAPPVMGAALMAGAGLCWAAYTVLGKGSTEPLSDTSGNFIRCVPLALPLLWLGWPHMTAAGAVYAVLSGAVASGLGYAVWYAALPLISRATSAYIQLTVPIIAAVGAVLLLGEALTGRLLLASAGILGGVALALTAAEVRRARDVTPAAVP
jgi:drug/metabolite transporter (DMT)-like permease